MKTTQPTNPAEAYDSCLVPAMFLPWSSELLALGKPRPGERVLDLACGTGVVARQVPALVGTAGKVVGVDLNPAMLAVAKSRTPAGTTIDWREGNAIELALPDESFELVLCQQGLQFFPDRAAGARHVHRVLARGGRAAIAVWQGLEAHEAFRILFQAIADALRIPFEKVAKPFSLGDAQSLRKLLESAGFSRVEVSSKTRETVFEDADRFLELSTLAMAAVMPENAPADPSSIVAAVKAATAAPLRRYQQGSRLVFPMTSNLAVAVKG
jgi:ubiquinone/menaquinone biosynthesis C-methylase UbiE